MKRTEKEAITYTCNKVSEFIDMTHVQMLQAIPSNDEDSWLVCFIECYKEGGIEFYAEVHDDSDDVTFRYFRKHLLCIKNNNLPAFIRGQKKKIDIQKSN